jgi:RNA polymerase primary sigma factor
MQHRTEAPPLSELDELAARAGSDVEARAVLVRRLLPVIRRWARRYAGRGVTHDDLVQDGVLGVLRAVAGFDASRGPFLAWARLWVRQAMQQAVAEYSRPFRLPTGVLWDMHELKQARERLGRDGAEPSAQRLADELGWGVDKLGDVLRAEAAGYTEDGMDLVQCPIADGDFQRVLEHVAAGQLRTVLTKLTEREREILQARAGGASLREIGREMGLSAERVRKVEAQALAKLDVATKWVDSQRLLVTSTGEPNLRLERRNQT